MISTKNLPYEDLGDTLKECPFCNTKDTKLVMLTRSQIYIMCKVCEAKGPLISKQVLAADIELNELDPKTTIRDLAIRYWNREQPNG